MKIRKVQFFSLTRLLVKVIWQSININGIHIYNVYDTHVHKVGTILKYHNIIQTFLWGGIAFIPLIKHPYRNDR